MRIPAPWALALWGFVLFALLAALAPRQTGRLAERAMPGVLAELSRAIHGDVKVEGYERRWLDATARVSLAHAALREPVALDVKLRHGPWLGEGGLGWLTVRIPWPEQGGIVPFPPGEHLEVRLRIDLFGRARLCLWRLSGKEEERLGEVSVEPDLSRLVGESRLPGLWVKSARGDVRLAEVDLRMRLERKDGVPAGVIGIDARRAALGQGEGAWLVEHPWLDLTLGERDHLDIRWAAARGEGEFGALHASMHWHEVDWTDLRASIDRRALRLNDPRHLRRQLDRIGLALGRGEIVLERFSLDLPQGQIELEGLLRGRDAPTGLRRLHLDLRLGMDRPVAGQLLRASRWVQDDAGAERLLSVLREQGILVEDDTKLRAAMTLWDGALTLSGRPMDLEDVLAPTLNSDGVD